MDAPTKTIEIHGLPQNEDENERKKPVVRITCNGNSQVVVIPSEFIPEGDGYLLSYLRWNIEDYATKDPFKRIAHYELEKKLASYISTLIELVLSALKQPTDLRGSTIIIKVLDSSTAPSSSLAIKTGASIVPLMQWECLEQMHMWPAEAAPKVVSVLRCTICDQHRKPTGDGASMPPFSASQMHEPMRRVLALSARPNIAADIPHRLITRTIYEVVQSIQSKVDSAATLDVARPGSLNALKKSLGSRPWGYYDIIHLDVHGVADEQSATLLLCDDKESSKVHHVQAIELANLLQAHGVRCVITNACQSAAFSHNFARTLVQHGASMVLGMQYKLLESAAEVMVRSIYQDLLDLGRSLPEAVFHARWQMRMNPERRTKYNGTVRVLDFMSPVLFMSSSLLDRKVDIRPFPTTVADEDNSRKRKPRETLVGRESAILNLENDLLSCNNLMFISGAAGSGKSALAEHVSWWWKATGMVGAVLKIDFATFRSVKWSSMVEFLCSQVREEIVTDEATLSKYLTDNPCLVVFDSIDELEPTTSLVDAISSFTKPIRKSFKRTDAGSFVLFLGRDDKSAIRKRTAADPLHLGKLNLESSLEFCASILKDKGRNFDGADSRSAHHLEQIVVLLERNPLAMKIVMLDFNRHPSLDISQYYERLTSNKGIRIDSTVISERAVQEAFRLVETPWGFHSFQLPGTPMTYLSPFWTVIPANLASYWKFLHLAHCRVQAAKLHAKPPPPSVVKAAAQEMDDVEYDFFHKVTLSELWDPLELESLDAKFSTALSRISRSGFLDDKSFVDFGPSEATKNKYFTISPIVTICLRALINDERGIAECNDLIATAFQRFCRWRYQLTYDSNGGNSLCPNPANQSQKNQLSYEAENIITTMNFMFSTTFNPYNWHFIYHRIHSDFAGYHLRLLTVVIPVLERGIDHYTAALQELKPNTLSRYWNRVLWTWLRIKLKMLPKGHSSQDPGTFKYSLFFATLDCCFALLGSATLYADYAGFEISKYQVQAKLLLRLAKSDHRSEKARILLESMEILGKVYTDIELKGPKFERVRLLANVQKQKRMGLNMTDIGTALTGSLERALEYDENLPTEEVSIRDEQAHKLLEQAYENYGNHTQPVLIYRLHMELFMYALHDWKEGESWETGKLDRALVHAKAMHDICSRLSPEEPWATVLRQLNPLKEKIDYFFNTTI